MNCPKCNAQNCKYIQRKPENTGKNKTEFTRTDFKAKCKKCGWTGVR